MCFLVFLSTVRSKFHAGSSRLSMTSVTLCVSALKEKRLELPTPNLAHIYSIVGTRYALTLRSKRQKSMLECYEMCCLHGYACRYDGLGFWHISNSGGKPALIFYLSCIIVALYFFSWQLSAFISDVVVMLVSVALIYMFALPPGVVPMALR